MSNTEHFDVVGAGYVAEQHADEKHQNLLASGDNAIGGAFAWLAFYVTAAVVVIVSNFSKTTEAVTVVASTQ